MNIETRQAYSEVNAFLQLIDSNMSNKIPKKLKNFFKREMDKKYQPILKKNIPLKEQNLRRKTIAIISSLYLQYWCTDMSKKEELLKTYKNNEIKYQEQLHEKYNPDTIFKVKNETNIDKKDNLSVIIKDNSNLFMKIIRKLIAIIK
jgi:hypothetical protein